ncbi:hypothetical protein GCM10010336_43480 [Streptomyces goshikiensis]|nr:hypothetical protein GCM10010336_43480 [Streptomyces goshikiensis]
MGVLSEGPGPAILLAGSPDREGRIPGPAPRRRGCAGAGPNNFPEAVDPGPSRSTQG